MRPWPLGIAHVRLHCWHRCRRRYQQMKAMHGHSSFAAGHRATQPGDPFQSRASRMAPERTWHQSSTASPATAATLRVDAGRPAGDGGAAQRAYAARAPGLRRCHR
jgi:hypothetical protein